MTEPYQPSAPRTTPSTQLPLSAAALADLFVRPTRFFRTVLLGEGFGWVVAIILVGISSTIAKVDRYLIQADLGHPRAGWESLGPFLTESWVSFWGFVILVGSVGAVLIWYVGGWWYNLRLRWSGARDIDTRRGRLVFTFATLVAALPSVGYAAVATVLYPNYLAAWEAEELWSSVLVVFPFWSVIASYRGVRATFTVRPLPARVWFLVLPMLAYAFALGILGVLYAKFTSADGGTAV